MKVMVLNCGSSSAKFQIIETENEKLIVKGLVEKVGSPSGIITYSPEGGTTIKQGAEIADHKEAIDLIIKFIINDDYGVLKSIDEIDAVGHRVVHGGERFTDAVIIDELVLGEIEKCIMLAPLHNPANLQGISACEALMPQIPQTAIFDTAFHQKMPKYAYIYGLPLSFYKRYGIRRYGFHGTSHEFVGKYAAQLLNKPFEKCKIITCHLGNGSSISAISNGFSIDTSMGFTPLEGLLMGTRCGDIDPAIIPFLQNAEKLDHNAVDQIMNKQSGLKGISGISNDMREIEEAASGGNENAQLAIDIFAYRIKKYIGAYFAALNGADAIVFTAGIGENSPVIREKCCENLENMGISLDLKKNDARIKEPTCISTGKTPVYVIPTNEELAIARKTNELITGKGRAK